MKKAIILAFFALLSQSVWAQFITNNGIDIVNTGIIYTNGDWANQGTLRNDGIIITTDDFINTGDLDAASTGGFILKYASDKSFVPGGSSFGFLVKEGAGNAALTGQFSVTDSLSIQGGLIAPQTAADLLTVAETGLVKSAPGSFLEGGNLVRKGTGDLFFPVGKNGQALPITFMNVQGTNSSITVTVLDAPTGYSAGSGVTQLFDFPFVWSATAANVDQSTYVELEYPNTITGGTDADVVVARKVSGVDQYEGMGARAVTTSAGSVRIRSYARSKEGIYTIAKGARGNLETDRAALVDFYTANGGAAANWTGWTSEPDLANWEGVDVSLVGVTGLSLPSRGVVGKVPDSFLDLGLLESIDLSNNTLDGIPDLTSLTNLTSVNLANNKLNFTNLLPNVTVPGIDYSNQTTNDLDESLQFDVGTSPSLSVDAAMLEGDGNIFQWKLNDAAILDGTQSTFTIPAIGRSQMGSYVLEVTNPSVPGLVLTSGTKQVEATATIAGTVFETETTPLDDGTLTLFRIEPVGAYTIVKDKIPVNTDGTYSLQKIVLNDYVLIAEANATTYPNDLPTYYASTAYWEESTPIVLNDNLSGIDILISKKPTETPKGTGIISGTFWDSDPTGGKTETSTRIGNAGVSIRRKTNVGKPEAEVLKIIAYSQTDEQGEFVFNDLEAGEYLVNLQKPGLPMDPTSDINIVLGATNITKKALLDAFIDGNSISVRRQLITGWDETETRMSVYPNPASQAFTVDVHQPMEGLSYTITNMMGEKIDSSILGGQRSEVNTSQFAPGVYLVSLHQNGTVVQTFKLVIQH